MQLQFTLEKLPPQQLFLIDGAGAFLTALMLGFVLPWLEGWFAMPTNVLYFLAGVAAFFMVYSLTCSQVLKKKWKTYLGFIMVANSCYCLLSLILVLYFFPILTVFDLIYFILEIIIIIVLVWVELNIWKQLAT